MAGELAHKSTATGTTLKRTDWEDLDSHVFDSQATGDMLIATSATQLSRLAITDNRILVSSGGLFSWSNTLPAFTLGGTVTLDGNVFDAGAQNATITTTGSRKGLEIHSADDSHGPSLSLHHTHTTPNLNADIAEIFYWGYDGAGTPAVFRYGALIVKASNITDGTEEGVLNIHLAAAGVADNLAMTLSGAGEGWFDLGVDADEYYKVAGTQVVSAQGAAVADPTDPASTQARLTDLLGRLRTHGLIAT